MIAKRKGDSPEMSALSLDGLPSKSERTNSAMTMPDPGARVMPLDNTMSIISSVWKIPGNPPGTMSTSDKDVVLPSTHDRHLVVRHRSVAKLQ